VTTPRIRILAALLFTTTTITSCRRTSALPAVVPPPPPLPAPSVNSQWIGMQSIVLGFVSENRPAAADSSLLQFARTFARTPEGDRARWWRALMRVDAKSASGDATLALALLDSLLADSIAIEVRTEAVLMRRSLNAIDSVRKAEVRRRVQATQLATDRGDELKTTRDSITKLNLEIQRLKRRLGAP
jgi:hypothetical protein